jgi:hypothetical protein
MSSKAQLNWNGDRVRARLVVASRAAISETLQAADDDASQSHSWQTRKGQLEEEIVTTSVEVHGSRMRGFFGTTRRRGFYGLFHEEGTVHEFARPFLRPAADRTFPSLAGRIARKLRLR